VLLRRQLAPGGRDHGDRHVVRVERTLAVDLQPHARRAGRTLTPKDAVTGRLQVGDGACPRITIRIQYQYVHVGTLIACDGVR
jgi:hypothetical protein